MDAHEHTAALIGDLLNVVELPGEVHEKVATLLTAHSPESFYQAGSMLIQSIPEGDERTRAIVAVIMRTVALSHVVSYHGLML